MKTKAGVQHQERQPGDEDGVRVCVCICGKHVERRHRRDDLLRVSSCVVCGSSTRHPVFAQATACRLHGNCNMPPTPLHRPTPFTSIGGFY